MARKRKKPPTKPRRPNLTVVKHRPRPNRDAQVGLWDIENIEVHFKGDVSEAEQDAALEHLSELIDWWNLPWHGDQIQ